MASRDSNPPIFLRPRQFRLVALSTLAAIAAGTALLTRSLDSGAQIAGGDYEIRRSTIDNGGGVSSGGGFELAGTVGQPDVGLSVGGRFEVSGGFWAREIQPLAEVIFGDSFED